MTNALRWFLAAIVIIIVGLLIWMAIDRREPAVITEDDTKARQAALAAPVLSVEAFNQTQNAPAATVNAQPQDVIVFTLVAENKLPATYPGFIMETGIEGLVTGATLIDAGGAAYQSDTQKLVWTPLDIAPNQEIRRSFSVRVNSLTAGSAVPVLRIQYNNAFQIAVGNPTIAGASTTPPVENGSYNAPDAGVGMGLNLILALASMTGFSAWRIARKKA